MRTQVNLIKQELITLQKELEKRQNEFEKKKKISLNDIDRRLKLLSQRIQQEFPEKNKEISKLLEETKTLCKNLFGVAATYQALLEKQCTEAQDDIAIHFDTYADSIHLES